MKITDLKVNGIKEPIGYYFENITVSWSVTDTLSQYAEWKCIEVSEKKDFSDIIYKAVDDEVESIGTILPIKLKCRTRYYCRISVRGNAGDETCETTWFETGKMQEKWNACWIGTEEQDNFHPFL